MYIEVASVSTVFFYYMLVMFRLSCFFSFYHTCIMDNLHISDKILKLNKLFVLYLLDLFSFNVGKSVLFEYKFKGNYIMCTQL